MKKIVFTFKPKPEPENKEIQEWRSYLVRNYPEPPLWLHVAGFAIIALGIALGYWVKHPNIGFFAGFVACFVLVLVAHPIRCMQCKGSVTTRKVDEEDNVGRYYHDCPVCKISWKCKSRRTSES